MGATLAISLGVSAAGAILPLLFAKRVKQPSQDKNQFPDIQIDLADVGAFIPKAWGKVKLPVNKIWSSGIRHYIRESSGGSGGKGGTSPGSGGTVREHIYQTNVALLCTDCGDYPINEFTRIWADNDTIYGGSAAPPNELVFEAEDATLSGGASVVSDENAHGGAYVTGIGSGGEVAFDFSGTQASLLPDDPIDITPITRIVIYYKCTGDKTVKLIVNGQPPVTRTFVDTDGAWAVFTYNYVGTNVDDFVNTLVINNPSGACPDIDYVTGLYDWSSPSVTDYPQVTGVIDPNITYPTDLDDPRAFYNYRAAPDENGSSVADMPGTFQIRFYTGTATQMPDPAIVAWAEERFGVDGADYVSAYRTFSYIVLENFTIKNGRMPNFTVELDAGRNDASEIVEDLYNLVNVEPEDLELDAISGQTVDGMLVYQFTPAAELIKKLQTWFNFQMVELDGKIKAVPEIGSVVATIPKEDLKAHDFGEKMPDFEADHLITDEQSLPVEIIVSAMDAAQDYHANPQSEPFFASTVATEPIEMSFPFVATPDEMKRVSNTQVAKAHLEAKPYTIEVVPKWSKLAPGDVINIELSTRTVKVKIKKKSMALMGRIRFEVVPHSNYIYENNHSTGTKKRAHSLRSERLAEPSYPRNSILVVIESIPILREHRKELGVIIAVSGRGLGRWTGATIYRDMGDEDFQAISVVDTPSPIGVCQNVLDDWTPLSDVDDSQELTIYFYDETSLQNVDESEARNNPALNLIRVGNEWLQFLTATADVLEPGSPYRSAWIISDFLRGRFDTETETGLHETDELAVVSTSALKWRRFETVEIGSTINLKAVTDGQAVEYAEIVPFELHGLSIQPTAKTDDYTVTLYDDLRTFSNDGASGAINFQLPAIASLEGMEISFVVIAGEALSITAFVGEQIFIGEDFGNVISSAAPGSFITIKAMDSGTGSWVATNYTGTWAV